MIICAVVHREQRREERNKKQTNKQYTHGSIDSWEKMIMIIVTVFWSSSGYIPVGREYIRFLRLYSCRTRIYQVPQVIFL